MVSGFAPVFVISSGAVSASVPLTLNVMYEFDWLVCAEAIAFRKHTTFGAAQADGLSLSRLTAIVPLDCAWVTGENPNPTTIRALSPIVPRNRRRFEYGEYVWKMLNRMNL